MDRQAEAGKLPGTLNEALAIAVGRWPEKVWLDFTGATVTFAEADAASTRLAHGLAAHGVVAGDRVCSIFDNHADCVMLLFALAKLGAIYVPVNTAFRGEFLRHQISDAGATLVAVDAAYVKRIAEIEDGIPSVRIMLSRGETTTTTKRVSIHAFADAYATDTTPIHHQPAPSDLAMLLYTSGTTGPSKGCMIPHRYLCHAGWWPNTMLGITEADVYWTPCPLFHMGATQGMIGTLLLGATMSIHTRFSLSGFWPEIERSRATVVLLLSAMLNYVVDAPDTEVSRRCHGQIRVIHGVPFAPALEEAWKQRFGVTYAGAIGYGMTECSPMTVRDITKPAPAGASGRRFASYDVQIVDAYDAVLPLGEVGEIVFRPTEPDIMFKGYWQRPEATVEANRNLWFHSGDIGRIDENGFLFWLDRKKDYLRCRGENVSSFELETSFRQHPDIEDLAVHAVIADGAEDEVKLTAILREGAATNEEALCRWSIERLPSFAVPRYIEFRHELPRNGVGRVLKYELRAQGVTSATWDRQNSAIALRRPARTASLA